MKDSWCDKAWNGKRWLYGAAAREYRLGIAGGVDAVARQAGEIAARQVLEGVNAISNEATRPATTVTRMPLTRRRRTTKSKSEDKKEL